VDFYSKAGPTPCSSRGRRLDEFNLNPMKKNVIILTSGLTGSSVLTGLIARAGYWTGDSTHKKKEYDTYENEELIDLNHLIFKQANYHGNYLMDFSPEVLARIGSLSSEDARFAQFIEKCAQHRPWVWKDPRLWLTMSFWKNFIDLSDCRFIVLTRGFRQVWVSTVLRGQIVNYGDSKRFEQLVRESITGFLKKNNASYINLQYEDLIVHPTETIAKLNNYLQTNLSLDDLKAVYHKPLYKTPGNSVLNFGKAVLKYLKNYSERLQVAPNQRVPGRLS
jgi:hypothetical protein